LALYTVTLLILVGAAICGAFVFAGVGSVVFYKPWRRWIEKRRILASQALVENNLECMVSGSEAIDEASQSLSMEPNLTSSRVLTSDEQTKQRADIIVS
jgi:hypothetical protein